MSMPFKIIKCDTCDYEAHSSCIWGNFDYVDPDGTQFDVNRTYGWCYSCQDIRPIEDLSDEEQLEDGINTNFQKIADIKSSDLLGRFLQLLGKNGWQISNLKEDIKNNQRRLEFLHERKSPPKCLTCSSTDIKRLNLPNTQGSNIEKITEFKHPNCGGHLLVKNSEWMVNVALSTKEYDLNGHFLTKI